MECTSHGITESLPCTEDTEVVTAGCKGSNSLQQSKRK